jgi:Darcynin, domain of unknown function
MKTMNLLLAAATAIGASSPLGAAVSTDESRMKAQAAQTFTIFMLVKTTPAWLKLKPDERFAFLREQIEPILGAHPHVRMRFFDSEGYNSRATDVILWETQDLLGYQSVVDALRETRFWGDYFEVIEIVPSVENAYAEAYDEKPVGGD